MGTKKFIFHLAWRLDDCDFEIRPYLLENPLVTLNYPTHPPHICSGGRQN